LPQHLFFVSQSIHESMRPRLWPIRVNRGLPSRLHGISGCTSIPSRPEPGRGVHPSSTGQEHKADTWHSKWMQMDANGTCSCVSATVLPKTFLKKWAFAVDVHAKPLPRLSLMDSVHEEHASCPADLQFYDCVKPCAPPATRAPKVSHPYPLCTRHTSPADRGNKT